VLLDGDPVLELLQDVRHASDQSGSDLKPVRSGEKRELVGGEFDERVDVGVHVGVDTGIPGSRLVKGLRTD
jgi:hypothetical protein